MREGQDAIHEELLKAEVTASGERPEVDVGAVKGYAEFLLQRERDEEAQNLLISACPGGGVYPLLVGAGGGKRGEKGSASNVAAELLSWYGSALLRIRGDTDAAEQAYLAALSVNGQDAGALSSYAVMCDRLGRWDAAGDLYARAVKCAEGRDADLLCNYGGFLWAVKKDGEVAAKLLERAVAANPGHAPSMLNLADIYGSKKATLRRAEELYEGAYRILDSGPASDMSRKGDAKEGMAACLQGLARVCAMLGNVGRARELLERLLRMQPGNQHALSEYLMLKGTQSGKNGGVGGKGGGGLREAVESLPDETAVQVMLGLVSPTTLTAGVGEGAGGSGDKAGGKQEFKGEARNMSTTGGSTSSGGLMEEKQGEFLRKLEGIAALYRARPLHPLNMSSIAGPRSHVAPPPKKRRRRTIRLVPRTGSDPIDGLGESRMEKQFLGGGEEQSADRWGGAPGRGQKWSEGEEEDADSTEGEEGEEEKEVNLEREDEDEEDNIDEKENEEDQRDGGLRLDEAADDQGWYVESSEAPSSSLGFAGSPRTMVASPHGPSVSQTVPEGGLPIRCFRSEERGGGMSMECCGSLGEGWGYSRGPETCRLQGFFEGAAGMPPRRTQAASRQWERAKRSSTCSG